MILDLSVAIEEIDKRVKELRQEQLRNAPSDNWRSDVAFDIKIAELERLKFRLEKLDNIAIEKMAERYNKDE